MPVAGSLCRGSFEGFSCSGDLLLIESSRLRLSYLRLKGQRHLSDPDVLALHTGLEFRSGRSRGSLRPWRAEPIDALKNPQLETKARIPIEVVPGSSP